MPVAFFCVDLIAIALQPTNNYTLGSVVILDWCEHDEWQVLM